MGTGIFGMAVRSIAAYAPPDARSNDWISQRLLTERERFQRELGRELTEEEARSFETNDRWIRRHIGFHSRRFVPHGEGTIDLATRAARLLVERCGLNPGAIDYIVFATVTPSFLNSPPDAALLQHALGIPEHVNGTPHELGGACTSLACSSWVSGLNLCYGLIRSGMARRILLIGADAMSTTINWRDRAFATVLGDAGTAVELVSVPPEEDWFSLAGFWNWLGGSRATTIITPKGGSRAPLVDATDLAAYQHCLTMDGRAVKEDMIPFVGGPAILAALAKAGMTFADLDLALLHEANLKLNGDIEKSWRTHGFMGTVLNAGGEYGNTTSASIPLALALNAAALQVGKRFGLFGFGGGYSACFAFGEIKSPVAIATDL